MVDELRRGLAAVTMKVTTSQEWCRFFLAPCQDRESRFRTCGLFLVTSSIWRAAQVRAAHPHRWPCLPGQTAEPYPPVRPQWHLSLLRRVLLQEDYPALLVT